MPITLTHCSACHALLNPAWQRCFVCGRHVTEPEQATPPAASHSKTVRPDPALSSAYRTYWQTAESAPMERFKEVYAEIAKLETQVDPSVAWRTLRETATAWHTETGVCPFCRLTGELHLPAETPERELRYG